jgi:hypothetical protein
VWSLRSRDKSARAVAFLMFPPSGGAKRVANAMPEPSFALGAPDIDQNAEKSTNSGLTSG